MVLLEFAMNPPDRGDGLSAYVARIIDVIDRSGEVAVSFIEGPAGVIERMDDAVHDDLRGVALELPLVGYTYAHATTWVPIDSSVPFLSEIPNREQILALEPDLIVCLNYESEWWPVAEIPYGMMWADDEHWLPLLLAGLSHCFRTEAGFDGLQEFGGETLT